MENKWKVSFNKPPPFKGLDIRIFILTPIEERGFINRGSTVWGLLQQTHEFLDNLSLLMPGIYISIHPSRERYLAYDRQNVETFQGFMFLVSRVLGRYDRCFGEFVCVDKHPTPAGSSVAQSAAFGGPALVNCRPRPFILPSK